MTKEITKSIVLQEMQDKLKLRELEPEKFQFAEMVVPVYNIEQHLVHPEVKTRIESVTTTGTLAFFEVPNDEKWHLYGYNVIFMTGTFTIAGVMIHRPLAANWFYLDLTAAQSTSYINLLPRDIVIFPGEDITVNVDGYSVTGNLEVRIDVIVETIR